MSVLGQGKMYGGHLSPCVAFNEKEERLLILDVWHYEEKDLFSRKGLVWARLEDVYKSMKTWDFDAKSNRGWLVIEKS